MVFGFASRASCAAECCRVVETRGERCGRSVASEESGGCERIRLVDSTVSGVAAVRSGGRSRSKSSNSGGSSVEGSGRETALALRAAGLVGSAG